MLLPFPFYRMFLCREEECSGLRDKENQHMCTGRILEEEFNRKRVRMEGRVGDMFHTH
jgi:hypothetical protein